MKALLAAFLTGLFAVSAAAGSFSISPDEPATLKYDGQPVATITDPRTDAAAKVVTEKNGFSVFGDGIRKEFALFDDRLEYTFDFSMPAGAPVEMVIHLLMPAGEGLVVHGGASERERETKVIKVDESPRGRFEPTPKGSFTPLRYFTLKTPGWAIAVDPDPAGACAEDPAYAESPLRIFSGRATPDGFDVVASVYRGYAGWPYHLKGKVIFYGDARPFDQVHPFAYANEYDSLERWRALSFTARAKRRSGGDPLPVGAVPYTPERVYGWLGDTSALVIRPTGFPSNVWQESFITSNAPGRFRIDAPPGYYYLTLNIGNSQPSGPFRLKLNGQEWLPRVQVAAGDVAKPSKLIKLDNGPINLQFEGIDGAPWLLNGPVVEPFGTLNEDFVFTRPWWNFKER